jgi:anti-sigma regulatory factor (Ser/Thr protein kinase)
LEVIQNSERLFWQGERRMQACQTAVAMTDSSQVGEARRQINRLARAAGFDEEECAKASIVATELATNLCRYATGGQILLRTVHTADWKWIEVLSIDAGPGIPDVDRSLQDGFSTGGTSGTGLGAARRLSAEFDVFSTRPGGTVVFCRLSKSMVGAGGPFSWGVVSRPAPNEVLCGDSWKISEDPQGFALMLVDGLGHGPEAARAADEAVDVFEKAPFAPLTNFFEKAHSRMRTTRGGAVAAAQIDRRSRRMRYLGLGNIAGALKSDDDGASKGLFSHNGTVGMHWRNVQEFTYDCPERGLLIMHSDGLQSRWSLESYPGLRQRHPAVIAGVLYRDFTRQRDDATVAVVRFAF